MQKLHISKTNKKILGVCGGIAETYDIDPTLVRLGAVVLCLLTGIVPIVIAYIVGSFIMPEDGE